MQKIGSITSTADSNGEWTAGNVAAGTPPTLMEAAWFNTVQRELANVVTGSGLALDPGNDAQVFAALKLLIKSGVTGVVGEARNAKMSVPSASATVTFTTDEIIVGTALGGLQYRISNFNKTINLATTGAGGMDAGAPPVSGFVGVYVIYNPTTGASALLAVNATTTVVPEVYGGANMPSGYTASALVSIWATNSNGQFKAGIQIGRRISFSSIFVLNTTGSGTSNPLSSFSIATAVPKNAKECVATVGISSNTTSGGTFSSVSIVADINGSGGGTIAGYSGSVIGPYGTLIVPISTSQTLYQNLFANAGSTTYGITISAYLF
ncbi:MULTISPECIES: hypothetical protein [Rahnella]|uniref:hypothetical protein n=1 Tax=Rahnella TaxID=34037 RepID=UPI003F6E212D